jgi:hypothetical protein
MREHLFALVPALGGIVGGFIGWFSSPLVEWLCLPRVAPMNLGSAFIMGAYLEGLRFVLAVCGGTVYFLIGFLFAIRFGKPDK